MATETFASSEKVRLLPRRAWRVVAGAIAVLVVAAIYFEVAAPMSAGLPVGWGQYHNSSYHLQVGTPPFWNVAADNNLYQGGLDNCSFAVVASPLSERALHTTLDAMRAPRWMGVFVTAPCESAAGADAQASLWRPTGQSVVVAGQREALQTETIGAPRVSDRVVASVHGCTYTFVLQEPTAAQAQQDMPAFLTLVGSFRSMS